MASDPSLEQRELTLIGKVEMRIALADSDTKLESTLKTYLAPLLLKLASDHISVRNKVIAICQHINTRVKPRSVQLPVPALVKQFKENPQASLIRHFDLVYIQQGVGRLSTKDKRELLPVVVQGIERSGSHGAQLFNLLLRLLEHFNLPLRGSKEDVELRQTLDVSNGDAAFLASWLGKLLLFLPNKSGPTSGSAGLTRDDYNFLTLEGKDEVWDLSANTGLNLTRTKILAARLLASGLFSDDERFLPALYASADPASSISDVGDDILKRTTPIIDFEEKTLLDQLFGLYFGENEKPRVRAPLRLKILGLLGRSTASTTFSQQIVQMVEDGIAKPLTDGGDVVMTNGYITPSSSGREATKLRSAIFTYINFVARYGKQESLFAIAPQVVSRLREFVENQGWPRPGMSEDLTSRGYAYEVIGVLAKCGPRDLLVEQEPRLELLRWLFESLAADSSGNTITISIEESLSTVLTALSRQPLDSHSQDVLEYLLIEQMEQSADLDVSSNSRIRSTRYVAVRFANRCLPYDSVKARWIDVLAVGSATSDRAEVSEEGTRGLSPYWYHMLNGSIDMSAQDEHSMSFPKFDGLMTYFFQAPVTSTEPMQRVQAVRRQQVHCFDPMVSFARHVLVHEALAKASISLPIDNDWERWIDAAVMTDENARDAVKSYLEGPLVALGSAMLLCALFEAASRESTKPNQDLVDFLALCPDALVEVVLPSLAQLPLGTNQYDNRSQAAHAFGLLASHPRVDQPTVQQEVQKLMNKTSTWREAVGAGVNQVHGATLALAYYFSRATYRGTVLGEQNDTYLGFVFSVLASSTDSLLREASYVSIGQLCMYSALSADTVAKHSTFRAVADKFYETAKAGTDRAVIALGQLGMILQEPSSEDAWADSDIAYLEEQMYKLHEIRQPEAHFTVGEALSYLACGWDSKALATKHDTDGPRPIGPKRHNMLDRMVTRILKDTSTTKPALKKASVLWLLCLLEFCGHLPELQARLPACQAAFKKCLFDKDELVQETASRGLGLVYEKGDRKVKDDLVRDLFRDLVDTADRM